MFQLKLPSRPVFDPILTHDPVFLRPPKIDDYPAWVRLRETSRKHLIRWEEDWTPDHMSLGAFRRRLKTAARDAGRGGGLSLFVFERDTGFLVGGATLSNLRYGASRSGILGYWIGAPFVRRGFGAAAVDAMSRHGIESIGLNRIEAACQPNNAASKAVLVHCGYTYEGVASDYLRINGKWRDHHIYALTARRYRALEQ